jgi:UDP-glucuronate decarboxylase
MKLTGLEPNFEDIFHKNPISFQDKFVDLGNVVITGSRGMFGNGVARYIVRLREEKMLSFNNLYLFSRSWPTESRVKWNTRKQVKCIENGEAKNLTTNIDVVFHCASPSNITKIETYKQLFDTNIVMLNGLLTLKPSIIVFLSSSEVYSSPIDAREDSNLGNFSEEVKRNWYPRAKILGEKLTQEFCEENGNTGIVIRLFHTFGPGLRLDDGRSFSDIMWEAARLKKITLKSSGDQIRTFAYLEDSVKAVLKVVFATRPGYQVFNVGAEERFSIYEFANKVANLTGAKLKKNYDSNFLHSPRNVVYPNVEKLKSLGWQSEWNIESAIENTIRWMRQH